MSSSYQINFENNSITINERLLDDFSKWLNSENFHYKFFWREGNLVELPFKDAISELPQGGAITFMNEKYNDFMLTYYPTTPHSLSIIVEPVNIREEVFSDAFIEIVKELYLRLKPSRVYSVWLDYKGEEEFEPDYVGWLHVFSPESVKQIGEEKILSAPVYQAEKLSDGAILIRLTRTFGEFSGDLQNKVRTYLFKNET